MNKKTKEQKREEMLKRIKSFRLLDDDFMTKCFEDSIECTELLLHIVMDKPDLVVKQARTQYNIKNLQGRSIRLDIFAKDSDEKEYNVEIQRDDKGAGVYRARHNSSLLDANAILPGEDVKQLPQTYVIFITENDVFEEGKPIYHVERVIRETGKLFGDGSHIIYVNGAYRDNSPLGKLLHDFACTNPADMNYKVLADRVRYFKEDKEGLESMCKIVEDMITEEIKESNIAIAIRMLERGKLSLEEIAEDVGLSVEEVKKISDEIA
ncbi:MAG: PD-(D/E)XK nuclease family transposase [Clostridium sp.]|nr:PD-(D/E)XK nuclease family transposase [Clostridium sp.]